jgi:hypothetical protein
MYDIVLAKKTFDYVKGGQLSKGIIYYPKGGDQAALKRIGQMAN